MGGSPAEDRVMADLAERYRPAVSAYFSRRLKNRADVEDLTQEVFARLLRRAASMDGIDNIDGYVFQIAANLLRERFRTASRRIDIKPDGFEEASAVAAEPISPERIVLGREAYARLVQALHELPERVRTVFVLNRYEQLSGREIAQRMGLSVSTVEKDMMRAMAHLRERVA